MYSYKPTDVDKHVFQTELNDFLPDKILDCHIHMWTNDIKLHHKPKAGGWVSLAVSELSAEDIIATHKEIYPGREVVPLVFGKTTCDIYEMNKYVEEKGKQYGFPTLYRSGHMQSGEELEEEVKKGGFLGLKPYLSWRAPYIPVAETRIFDFLLPEHLEAANRNGWIVILHIPRSERLRDKVNLAQLMEIEEKYPNVKLVVAHVGRAYSKQDLGDAFDLLKNTKNMQFDFSANVCDDAIKACIEAVGTKRLMFGTDMPYATMRMFRTTDPDTGFYFNNVPPGLYGEPFTDPHMKLSDREDITTMLYEQLRAFKRVALDMKLKDSEVEDIMYNNAKNLIDSCK